MRFCNQVILSLTSISVMGALVLQPGCEAFMITPANHNIRQRGATIATTSSRNIWVSITQQRQQRNSLKQRVGATANDDEDYDTDDEDEDYDDEYEPLGKGIDSVSWLPSVIGETGGPVAEAREGAEVLPLFPLGGFVYTPNTEHILNIFEPRYRQMYTDILMNGSKRFVVTTSHPDEKGRFAQTGVLFELEDLKEVSEQTADQIKYICSHKVTGRVTIHKVLNPEAWTSRDTYLKVEGTITDDSGKSDEPETDDVYGAVVAASKSAPREEEALRESFKALVTMQHDLEENVRFTLGAADSLAVKDGPSEDGLWQTIRLWQSFADQRLMARQNELQKDFQEKLQEYLKKEKGIKEDELPSTIGFQDLSPSLQEEVRELQKRMGVELQPLVLESSLTMQKILEAKDHRARCKLLKFFIDAERKRLDTKRSLQGLFAGEIDTSSDDSSSMPKEEMISTSDDSSDGKGASKKDDESSETKPMFFDEPDAFQ